MIFAKLEVQSRYLFHLHSLIYSFVYTIFVLFVKGEGNTKIGPITGAITGAKLKKGTQRCGVPETTLEARVGFKRTLSVYLYFIT